MSWRNLSSKLQSIYADDLFKDTNSYLYSTNSVHKRYSNITSTKDMINEMVCSHYSWSERAQHTVVILVMQDALILRTDHVATHRKARPGHYTPISLPSSLTSTRTSMNQEEPVEHEPFVHSCGQFVSLSSRMPPYSPGFENGNE
jgi:hypothetical protein